MILAVLFVVSLIVLAYFLYPKSEKLEVPKTGYYGSGTPKLDDTTVRPFKIEAPESALEELHERLKNSRIGHQQLEDVPDFEYGFNLKTLLEFKDYWLNEYDWRKQEELLNSFQHFTTQIEGLRIHFIHEHPPEGKYKKVIPLLIVHGWPGNVFEFYKIIPMLTDPNRHLKDGHSDVAFSVVAPSIPGYGWSEQPKKSGFNLVVTARIFNKLMTERLDYSKFLVQGGDWGAGVVSSLGKMFPENYKTSIAKFMKETGYYHIQSTKPDTVGVSLNDSPIGLLAYILEKFSGWTNGEFVSMNDGGLERKFTKDELITIVMIYWLNQNIVSSQRYYKERWIMKLEYAKIAGRYLSVPTGYAAFKHDLGGKITAPLEFAKDLCNIQHYTYFKDGGHFAAFEMPEELAKDVFTFFKKVYSA